MIDSESLPSLGTLALPPLQGESDRVVWPAMFDLADRLPEPWVMIGGQMIILHGLLAGRSIPRVTKDIEYEVLKKLGYEVDGISADGKAHRYLHPRTGMMVDLLALTGSAPVPSRSSGLPLEGSCRSPVARPRSTTRGHSRRPMTGSRRPCACRDWPPLWWSR